MNSQQKVLAKIKTNSSKENKSDVVYLTPEEFKKPFYVQNGDRRYCLQPDAIEWSKYGRLGSHWQIGDDMFVLVEKKGDDPYKYYEPDQSVSGLSTPSWHIKPPCPSGGGNCGSGCSC